MEHGKKSKTRNVPASPNFHLFHFHKSLYHSATSHLILSSTDLTDLSQVKTKTNVLQHFEVVTSQSKYRTLQSEK